VDIKEFIGLLRRPRAVMMFVPAGAQVNSVITDLLPHLDKGDLIIDAGNSYFKDIVQVARVMEDGTLVLSEPIVQVHSMKAGGKLATDARQFDFSPFLISLTFNRSDDT
jgi:3-hydroxyisobutyrate dehydrogenase-like beta-hydroxyacid dehydrogenase